MRIRPPKKVFGSGRPVAKEKEGLASSFGTLSDGVFVYWLCSTEFTGIAHPWPTVRRLEPSRAKLGRTRLIGEPKWEMSRCLVIGLTCGAFDVLKPRLPLFSGFVGATVPKVRLIC